MSTFEIRNRLADYAYQRVRGHLKAEPRSAVQHIDAVIDLFNGVTYHSKSRQQGRGLAGSLQFGAT